MKSAKLWLLVGMLLVVGVVVVAVVLVMSGSSQADSPPGPHAAMIGHWRQVDAAVSPVPGYSSTMRSSPPSELYIDRSTAWRVEQGEPPRRIDYHVSDVDPAAFTLTQTIRVGDQTITSKVEFSADRSEMRNSRSLSLPVGQTTLTTVYRRVGNETTPPSQPPAR